MNKVYKSVTKITN